MRKYLLHVLIISFVFLLTPTAHVASYAESEIEFQQERVRNNPDDPNAYVSLGLAYGRAGKWEKAIESYKKATWVDSSYAVAYYGLGGAYVKIGDTESALKQHSMLEGLADAGAYECRKLAEDLWCWIYPNSWKCD